MEEFHLAAPCDGLLSVWNIKADTVIPVKQSQYTIQSLLKDETLASEYKDGLCLVFRLCVDNYHRYAYADSGKKGPNIFIPGILHTVRPIALEASPVFTENCREYTVIESPVFGKLVQMEVGAMLVGRIVNLEGEGTAVRGKEKGFFEYGGSTIIVLLKKDAAVINENILKNSATGIETPVKMGEQIGIKA
jgi:phosphatidylserine decarboxylase